eukprot:TRINITY_DN15026_c0_g1_i4.p1 TRINITY_DN15026_c0_g1~~TRINITY_DN15026_c0_g1_i4.p1  ORF type:complete len:380 (+),score=61.02 TRINITY_DN15026_c0_g1_i4:90-1229(+)
MLEAVVSTQSTGDYVQVDPERIRLWEVVERPNGTRRPSRIYSISPTKFKENARIVFVEVLEPPHVPVQDKLLIFLKYYDPITGKLSYLDKILCPSKTTILDLECKVKLKLSLEDEMLIVWEEVSIEQFHSLPPRETLGSCGIGNGAIIIFQKQLKIEDESKSITLKDYFQKFSESKLTGESSSPGQNSATSSNRKKITLRPKFFNSCGRKRNAWRASLTAMKRVQTSQLIKFRQYARKGNWVSFQYDHYDWFMFPIEDGSRSQYNVLEDDVKELCGDQEWLSNYLESIGWVAKSWAWDIQRAQPVLDRQPGMEWDNWDVRLAKIIRSLWLFDQGKYMKSMQQFARTIAPNGGLYYGGICLDEVFLMRVEESVDEECDSL